MPLERPRREPIIGADGKLSPVWARYFEEIDTTQTVSDVFEVEAEFLGQPETTTVATQVRQARTALEAELREVWFLGI